jgi:hypothetical protein
MPSFKKTSLRFIKDVLKGDKVLLKAAQINHFNVPWLEELSVNNLLLQFKNDPKILKHLDYYADGKYKPDASTFMGLSGLCTQNTFPRL